MSYHFTLADYEPYITAEPRTNWTCWDVSPDHAEVALPVQLRGQVWSGSAVCRDHAEPALWAELLASYTRPVDLDDRTHLC